MSVGLLDSPEDLIDMLEDKVRHGWVLVFGDSKAINDMEWRVYTPGTPANAHFGVFMLPGFPPRSLFIARKTSRLRELLQWEKHGFCQREWDLPFILEFDSLHGNQAITCITIMRNMEAAVHFIEVFVRGELH